MANHDILILLEMAKKNAEIARDIKKIVNPCMLSG
jgi:hypothetical protein